MNSLIVLSITLPLLLALMALFESLRSGLIRSLPWAVLPALCLALLVNENLVISLPYGLTGVLLGIDETRRLFLLLATLLWGVAGVYAIGYLERDVKQWQFSLFWLLTLSGNLGLILSFDALSFYSFFALMTFAGYGLVVHTGSSEATYAGRIYLIMAMMGEGLLLVGLLAAVYVAGVNPALDQLPLAIANSSSPVLISMMILLGFGIKAGLPILHLWLPLAHPVAPVPASAVLSGVMIKAGLLGWLIFLPLGEMSLTTLGILVVVLGVVAAIGAALIGICQRKAKTVLAYSSISQMGWMTMMVGLMLLEASLAPILIPLVALFALHHGLAKGALFLSVPMNTGRTLSWLWVLLPAFSLMGLPFTSGLLVKTAFKRETIEIVSQHWILAWLPGLLSIAAIGTCLLMFRFLGCLTKHPSADSIHFAQRGSFVLLSLLSGFAFLGLPFLGASVGIELTQAVEFGAVYPLLLASLLILVGWMLGFNLPKIPPGDLLIPIRSVMSHLYAVSNDFVSARYEVSLQRMTLWLNEKKTRYQDLVAPEVIETAMRKQVVWIFLGLAVSFVAILRF